MMSDETDTTPRAIPRRIKGAKLVEGQWQDLEGQPLSTADLIRLREAEMKEKAERAKQREAAKNE
jgi:hypothetical protein